MADRNNHRIQVFTAVRKFLRMFGGHGEGRGELMEPVGVAIDTSGVVYVTEDGNHCVSVFTSEGQHVTSFGGRGRREGQLHRPGGRRGGELDRPRGVAVESSGVVYVCENKNKRGVLMVYRQN